MLGQLVSRQTLDRWYRSLPGFLAKMTCWNKDMDTRPWEKIYTEDNAGIFAEFLYKLYQGKNSKNAMLCDRVVNWLAYLANDDRQALRKHTFLLAKEAAENCVDRAAFYFNYMYILMVEHQLLGSDALLMQIIKTIQGTFRLQVLERIAAEKVAERRRNSPGFGEDLEIYLAYQSALRGPLSLPIYTELQFEQVAALTEEDIRQARQTVDDVEKTDFLRYWLTESALWTAKLTSWNPEKKAAVDSQYLDEIASADFNEAVEKALSDKGVAVNDTDAHRDVSKMLAADLFYQYRYQLTREYLEANQLLSLLDGFCMTPNSLLPTRHVNQRHNNFFYRTEI